MKRLLALAACIYFLIAPFTYHPDNKMVLNWASQDEGKVWDIWRHDLKGLSQFNYPPLHFYLDKLQYAIAQPIGGEGFYEWLSSQNSVDHNEPQLSRYSFAIKFPLILFALATGYLLYAIAKQSGMKEQRALTVAGLWLLNPITLYSIPMMGQNDVMAITAFLAGWYLLNSRRPIVSSVLFGAAASIKQFPLFWLPFLLLADTKKSVTQRVIIFISSIAVYLLTLLPFITNPVFREAVFGTGIDRMFIARLDLGFEDAVLIVPALLMILLAGVLQKSSTKNIQEILFSQSTVLLALNMLLLFFNHTNPQWFAWLVPFWALWMIQQEQKNGAYLWLGSLSVIGAWGLIILLFKDAALTFGMFTPLNPSFGALPSLHELLLRKGFDVLLYNNYAHTWLAGTALIFLIWWLNGKMQRGTKRTLQILIPEIAVRKSIRYSVVLFMCITAIIFVQFAANFLPIPLSGKSPDIRKYTALTTAVSQQFVAEHDRMNRIDLYFRKLDVKNNDPYVFTLRDQSQSIVHQQQFTGFNTGYEESLRFDIPLQFHSQGEQYSWTVEPLVQSVYPVQIGNTVAGDSFEYAFRTEYEKPVGAALVQFAAEQTISQLWGLLKLVPALVIALLVLLWIAL